MFVGDVWVFVEDVVEDFGFEVGYFDFVDVGEGEVYVCCYCGGIFVGLLIFVFEVM